MKKNSKKGFILAETLIVTTFVAGVLIFLFIQFSNLSNSYNESYEYNTVEGLYSLNNIADYIKTDNTILTQIESNVNYDSSLDITDCSLFSDNKYCLLLLELENIKKIYVVTNTFNKESFYKESESLKKFLSRINSQGDEKYRLLAEFSDSTFATIRFGD